MINLHNSKALAGLCNMVFPDSDLEWKAYCEEFPERVKDLRSMNGAEERFAEGNITAIEVFRKTIEYMPRSLIRRPLQTFLARQLMYQLTEEKKNRVLDYGCGAGNMGLLFAQAGFDTTLLEVEGEHTHFLRWRVKKHYLQAKVLGDEDELGKYDLVMLFNVLEHLMEPKKVLERITNSLDKDGYFCLMFNTGKGGLDIVSWEIWEKELKPYLLENFDIVPDTDECLYRRK